MPKKLTNLKITKVSLVDEGACSAAHITLFKNKDGGQTNAMNFDEILSTLTNEQQSVIKAKCDELEEKVKVAAEKEETVNAENEKLVEEKEKLEAEKDELEKAAEEKEPGDEEKEELKNKVKELEEELVKFKNSSDSKAEEDLLKNVDPAIKEMIQKAKHEADIHKQAVLKMKEEQENTELTKIAKSLNGIGTDENNMVSMLRKAKNTDSELYTDILKAFESANNIITDSMIMKSIGSAGEQVEGDAWAKLDSKAEEIAKTRGISKQKATGVVMSEYPELYHNYLNQLK